MVVMEPLPRKESASSMPAPLGCIPLSDSTLNVRAQNIAPLQDVESILGSSSTHYMPQLQLSTNTIYPASYRRSFFSAKPTFFPRSGFFFGRRGM